jgi:hypothetical protein
VKIIPYRWLVLLISINFVFCLGGFFIFSCQAGSVNSLLDTGNESDGDITADADSAGSVDNLPDEGTEPDAGTEPNGDITADADSIEDDYPTEQMGVDENHADETQNDGDGNIEPSYYVSTSGLDTNPGTFLEPWRTIQKAADTMKAGDTVIVLDGDYTIQRVMITKSGTQGAPIRYQAQGQVVTKGFSIVADDITINGFEIANTDYRRWDRQMSAGIYVKGANNTLDSNYIHDCSLGGIELYGPPGDNTATHDNIVRNNRLYHNEMLGIDVNGRSNLIEGNEVWRSIQCHPNLTNIEDVASDNNGQQCPFYPAVAGLDADGMRFFGQNHIFRKNKIHDIVLGDTIDGVNVNVNPHIDCFQTWAGTDNELAQHIIFEQNYCENLNIGMYTFMLESVPHHLYIQNNIFMAAGGINTGGGADYLYVYHNLWVNNLAFGSQGYPGAIGLLNVPNAIIKNNIFYDQPYQTVTVIGDTTNIEIDYNLAYNSDGSTPHCVQWGDYDTCQPTPNHELWNVNPQFLNPASGDYHLPSTSPVIDHGDNLGNLLTNDFDGVFRPQGAGFDIGPYEFPSP